MEVRLSTGGAVSSPVRIELKETSRPRSAAAARLRFGRSTHKQCHAQLLEAKFAEYNERFAIEAIAPIQNKVGTVLSPPPIRNMPGQVRSTIDIRGIMDRRRVLIVNLAKGKLGEAPTHLLGAFLATAFAQADHGL